MDDFDDGLDIDLQDPDDIGSRLILLSAVVLWPKLEVHERKQWMTWMGSEGCLQVATDFEIDLLKHPDEGAESESAAAIEALVALAWSVGLIPELPSRSHVDQISTILDAMPTPPERVEPFLNGLIQLDENVLALERERAEIWTWRLRSEILRRMAKGIELVEITEAIREVVLEAAAVGAIPDNDGTDFQLEGVAVREIPDEQFNDKLMIAEERLRALNWVCGLTDWELVDLDD